MAKPNPETHRAADAVNRRILVVDDDCDFAEGLDLVLSPEGYDVKLVRGAAQVRESLESFQAEVALVDIRLAGSSGINLIATLKQDHPGILCVMMTAFASTDSAIEALQQGAYDYLRKPFGRGELLATLDRCFERLDLEAAKSEVDAALRARNQELEQINKRLRLVVHGMRGLTSYATLRELCPWVLEEVARHMEAGGGSVYLNEGGRLILKHSLDPGHAPGAIPLPLARNSAFGQALTTGQPVLVAEIDPGRNLLPSGWTGYADKSLLVFPLLGDNGDDIGVLSLHSKADPPFTVQDRDIGQILISFACETIRAVQALEELANSEERFRSLVESCPICIQELDLSGKLISMNPAALDMMGLKAESDAYGRDFFASVDPADLRRVKALFDQACAGTPCIFENAANLECGARNLSSCFAPLVGPDGAIHKIMAIIQDITERKEAEDQLRQAQKIEAIGQLTSGVAHDFNNLLAIIMGNTEQLARRLGNDDVLSRYTRTVIRAAVRGSALTQRLLAFSRRQPLRPRPIHVSALVNDMKDMLVRTLGETIKIETKAAPDLRHILADPNQVENALLNLAINARDAMPGGGNLTIEMANVGPGEAIVMDGEGKPQDSEYVVMIVRDSGVGMPPEVLERVFEPFFTTKKIGEGSGLGLSMVYGFAKQSGGHLEIESKPEEGTTVRLYLPKTEAAAEPAAPVPDVAVEPAARGETVLIVEDDADVRLLIVSQLEELGYRVFTAEDGATAIAKLAKIPRIDVLICDIILPGRLNGVAVAEEARKHDPNVKTLFMSGYPEVTGSDQDLFKNGAYLLKKPFQLTELAQELRTLLGDRAAAADRH